jgi:hypothetical protein
VRRSAARLGQLQTDHCLVTLPIRRATKSCNQSGVRDSLLAARRGDQSMSDRPSRRTEGEDNFWLFPVPCSCLLSRSGLGCPNGEKVDWDRSQVVDCGRPGSTQQNTTCGISIPFCTDSLCSLLTGRLGRGLARASGSVSLVFAREGQHREGS